MINSVFVPNGINVFIWRPFVKKSSTCLLSMSVLSVALVYCGQMVGWMKMVLGMEV